MVKNNFKSAVVGLAAGLAVAAGGTQAAARATQHEHIPPSAQTPAAGAVKGMEGMKDMHAMMADPVMHQKMMANMAQCRDMMAMMMEHMKHEGKMGDAEPAPPKQ